MDWSELIKLVVAGAFGAMSADLARYLRSLSVNRYRWRCPHPSCNLRVKSNYSGTILRIQNSHFTLCPNHKP